MDAICSSLRGSGESKYPQVTTLGGMREARSKAKGAGTSCVVKRKCMKAESE
jgi:hypothetical protein